MVQKIQCHNYGFRKFMHYTSMVQKVNNSSLHESSGIDLAFLDVDNPSTLEIHKKKISLMA